MRANRPTLIRHALCIASVAVMFLSCPHSHTQDLTPEEFLFASRTAIDIDRTYEQYRSTFDTFLPYEDFRALILGEHWQPAPQTGMTVPTEGGPAELDSSSTDLGFIWVLDRGRFERSYVALLGALSSNTLSEGGGEWEYSDGIVGFEVELEDYGNLVAGQFITRRPVTTAARNGELVFAAEEGESGTVRSSERQYTFLDVSAQGVRLKGYGDWNSGTVALLDVSLSMGQEALFVRALENIILVLGSSLFPDTRSGRLYATLADIPIGEQHALELTVETVGDEDLSGIREASVSAELTNAPRDWLGFNYSLAASVRVDDELTLLPGARATLGFPRLFYNTQIELGVSYDYVDVSRRLARSNEFAVLLGFNTLIAGG